MIRPISTGDSKSLASGEMHHQLNGGGFRSPNSDLEDKLGVPIAVIEKVES
jgi:hypothetical protein